MTRLLLGALVGGLLGALYFGGLWLTVRAVEEARRPGLRVAASYLGRLAVAAVGFGLLAARGGFPAVASALVTFLTVRYVLVRRLGAVDGRAGRPRPRWSEPAAQTVREA